MKIVPVQFPEKIAFNYDELKAAVMEVAGRYENLIYSEEQIKEAKADKANLNKLRKAINDERIRREREYMEPFNLFKKQVDEILKIIDKPVALIDTQLKDYDERKKLEKRNAIEEYFDTQAFEDWLTLDMIFNPKWLNASVSMNKVVEEIDEKLAKIDTELETLEQLPEFSFEAVEVYKKTLDINKAIAEGRRLADIQKRKKEYEEEQARVKAEQEEVKQEPVAEPTKPVESVEAFSEAGSWIKFSARLTVAQALELRDFFTRRGIDFQMIKE